MRNSGFFTDAGLVSERHVPQHCYDAVGMYVCMYVCMYAYSYCTSTCRTIQVNKLDY